MKNNFDVIVIGGGHAGTESALAASRCGAKTLLITQKISSIGQMSCNPSIGGIGKGHLAKEVDALGGIMAICADLAGIHFRTLNKKKGPAVWATRAQADRELYKKAIQSFVLGQNNLEVLEDEAIDLLIESEACVGIKTLSNNIIKSKNVVITAGTFLNGKIFIGNKTMDAGRSGDKASKALADKIKFHGLTTSRLKTGTPPRLDGKTINFNVLTPQPGDEIRPVFSIFNSQTVHPKQINCFIGRTNEKTHELIDNALKRSPLFNGVITGKGPRYCPSIEDKITRFSEKNSHQIFFEPEGLSTDVIYPNGISTSLPEEDQLNFIRSIAGLEKVEILKYGYAVEYDFINPQDLYHSLESKNIKNLFLAGQINGTTGYEEAAAQGILAGSNAAQKALENKTWAPARENSYLGVLVDDLITQGAPEPYRMFTSRAEHRLFLREDNADARLSKIGFEVGSLSKEKYQKIEQKLEQLKKDMSILKSTFIQEKNEKVCVGDILKRPEMDFQKLIDLNPRIGLEKIQTGKQCWIEFKYSGYISRQSEEVQRAKRYSSLKIPVDIDYAKIRALSNEAIEKLSSVRPTTLGQASRISGITPATISILRVQLKVQNSKAIND